MQRTYQGRTCGGILKTARVAIMRAGNAEITVTLPNGDECFIRLIATPEGARPAAMLFDVGGNFARLSASAAAVRRIHHLHEQADKMMGV